MNGSVPELILSDICFICSCTYMVTFPEKVADCPFQNFSVSRSLGNTREPLCVHVGEDVDFEIFSGKYTDLRNVFLTFQYQINGYRERYRCTIVRSNIKICISKIKASTINIIFNSRNRALYV